MPLLRPWREQEIGRGWEDTHTHTHTHTHTQSSSYTTAATHTHTHRQHTKSSSYTAAANPKASHLPGNKTAGHSKSPLYCFVSSCLCRCCSFCPNADSRLSSSSRTGPGVLSPVICPPCPVNLPFTKLNSNSVHLLSTVFLRRH